MKMIFLLYKYTQSCSIAHGLRYYTEKGRAISKNQHQLRTFAGHDACVYIWGGERV